MKSKSKTLGQVFTPSHVAEFMVELATAPKNGRVLEPACGEGVFLRELSRAGFARIDAYEVDQELQIAADTAVTRSSFIGAEPGNDFDLVIGNPPYIRWKHLSKELKDELLENAIWQAHFTSLSDYLGIFILKSVTHLREGGELVFITPEYWLGTAHARQLREFLVKNGYFTDIFHFSETPIFDRVASSILIFRFVKSRHRSERSIRVTRFDGKRRLTKRDLDDLKGESSSKHAPSFEIPQFEDGAPWTLAPVEVRRHLRTLERACVPQNSRSLFAESEEFTTVGDVVDIGNGLVSGCDAAFRLADNLILTDQETEATLTVLKGKGIRSFVHAGTTRYIFPQGFGGTASDFAERYPHFSKQLARYGAALDARYSYGRELPRWDWAFLRSFNLFQREVPKLFVPCKDRIEKRDRLRFALVPAGVYPTQDVTALVPKKGTRESIEYIAAFLNSPLVCKWVRHKGLMKGNIAEFSETPLARIPMRLINWHSEAEVRAHQAITEAVRAYLRGQDRATLDLIDQLVIDLLEMCATSSSKTVQLAFSPSS